MRKNAEKALKAFESHESKNCESIWTNGDSLFSYRMQIAYHTDGGIALVQYDKAPTNTTRTHVRAAEVYFGKRVVERF